jgi:hypothetical protein
VLRAGGGGGGVGFLSFSVKIPQRINIPFTDESKYMMIAISSIGDRVASMLLVKIMLPLCFLEKSIPGPGLKVLKGQCH